MVTCSGLFFLFGIFIVFSLLQLKEENSVHGSDEEVDDPPEACSDEDFSDDGDKQVHEEVWMVAFVY